MIAREQSSRAWCYGRGDEGVREQRTLHLLMAAAVLVCGLVWSELASASVCSNLHQKADRLYKRAIKLTSPKKPKRAGQLVPTCAQKGAGRKAETLYRAALVYKCPKRYLTVFRLATLYQACVVSKRTSCRYYGMYRRACKSSGACRRSVMEKEKQLGKLLPFLIQDAQTDSDNDGFKSCLKTRVECSALAQIKEIPLPGLGKDGTGKPGKVRCDCDDGDNKVRPGAFEICDGKDNDCDGLVDEAKELKPPPCSNQRGVCRGARKRCGGARGWLLCEAVDFRRKGVAYELKETKCDALDNDCDGQTDNNLNAPKCRNQRGVCLGSKKVCGGKQGWMACSVNDFQKYSKQYELSEGRCDGLDNDCDGRADNIREAPSCALSAGVCVGLKKKCGGKRGWLACREADYRRHAASYEVIEKRCDSKDNDCDGKVDETCTPIYPWIIAGSGAAIVIMGGLVSGLSVHDPETVAATPQPARPNAAEVRGLVTFGTTSVVIGSVAAAAGLGIGLAFVIRALQQRGAPPKPPPAGAKAGVSNGLTPMCVSAHQMCQVAARRPNQLLRRGGGTR